MVEEVHACHRMHLPLSRNNREVWIIRDICRPCFSPVQFNSAWIHSNKHKDNQGTLWVISVYQSWITFLISHLTLKSCQNIQPFDKSLRNWGNEVPWEESIGIDFHQFHGKIIEKRWCSIPSCQTKFSPSGNSAQDDSADYGYFQWQLKPVVFTS